MSKKALILMDFENEWILPTSDYFVGDISHELSRTNQLIDYCRANKYKIIFTTHVEPESTGPFAPKSNRSAIMDELHYLPKKDILITKHKISPFYQTNLEEVLRGINEIVVAGILTNLCVRSTIQDAYDRDFDVTVITNCCIAMDEQTQRFTFSDLKATREEISIVTLKKFIG